MKRVLISLLCCVAISFLSCAGMTVQKQTTDAVYFETVYWGEEQECHIGENATYIGRCSKTYQVFPEEDMFWVKEENSNGDEVTVTLVWDMPELPALGVCFYNTEIPEGQPKENCGVLVFDSLISKHLFMNEFDQSGIVNAIPVPGNLHGEAARQIEATKDHVVGEPCDLCKFIEEQMGEVE